MEETFPYTDASVPLDVLLGACLVLVAHVHHGGCLASVHFVAEEAAELLVDLAGCSSDGALLTGAILARSATLLDSGRGSRCLGLLGRRNGVGVLTPRNWLM